MLNYFCVAEYLEQLQEKLDLAAGLCCVVEMSDDYYVLYDAGNYTDGGRRAFEAVSEIIPDAARVPVIGRLRTNCPDRSER